MVTEKGRIACDAVVLAGGAWSRLFCGNLDIRLPQLKVRASVMRTAPIDGGPETSRRGSRFRLPQAAGRRLHGRQQRHQSARHRAGQFPVLLRLPAGAAPGAWPACRLRFGRAFFDEWHLPSRWSLDQASPFERVRVLDPPPVESQLAAARGHRRRHLAGVQGHEGGGKLGAAISTSRPTCVPVISAVDALPGLVPRHRVLRPRLRHRPGRRAARGRPGHGPAARRRSRAVPLLAILRRDEDPAGDRNLSFRLWSIFRRSGHRFGAENATRPRNLDHVSNCNRIETWSRSGLPGSRRSPGGFRFPCS